MSDRYHPSVDLVRQLLRYENGKLFWLTRPKELFKTETDCLRWNVRFAGKEAGSLRKIVRSGIKEDRWIVGVNYQLMLRARLVWAFHHGDWPETIDHENRITLDDRIENLRPATGSQNCGNQRRRVNNTSGFKGVYRKGKKWAAHIRENGKPVFLGVFATPEEAFAAYCVAAKRVFGEFACDGERAIK